MRPPAAALTGSLALVVLSACTPSRLDVQEIYARALEPAPVRPASPAAPGGAVARVVRVRAYAGDGFREHAMDFAERIGALVRRASAIVEADFGVRLELESVREWHVAAAADEDLAVAIGALVREDPARDVDWVVGFVGPAEPGERAYERLGQAHVFGRHFVLREMQSSRLVGWVERSFDELSSERRAAMIERKRLHQETAAFLHEWGHTLGAVHECADKGIMARGYTVMASSFSPESASLVRLGLEQRDRKGKAARQEWARAYRLEIGRMSSAWWDCRVLERDLEFARWTLEIAAHAFSWDEPLPDGPDPLRRWLASVYGALGPRLRAVSAQVRTEDGSLARQERIAVVDVQLGAEGEVKGVRVLLSGGVAVLDEGAVEAIRQAQPFPRPPPEFFGPPLRGHMTFGVRAEL